MRSIPHPTRPSPKDRRRPAAVDPRPPLPSLAPSLAGAVVRLALVALVLTALPRPATATVVEPMGLDDLARESDLVLVGVATDRHTQWVDGLLVTLVTVEPVEVLKGTAGSKVTVAVPGGIDADGPVPVAVTYAGAPTFGPGEEAFLFLESDGLPGAWTVTGFFQGKLSIVSTPSGRHVVRDPRGPGDRQTSSLDAFRARVLELIAVPSLEPPSGTVPVDPR